ncbi:MAG TPA: hypothetical protein IAC60_05650 [Candidatus Enterosoma merdigallinarum]|nr:hypothetical protein [Candidatus Enterosoma merdigallinarum]
MSESETNQDWYWSNVGLATTLASFFTLIAIQITKRFLVKKNANTDTGSDLLLSSVGRWVALGSYAVSYIVITYFDTGGFHFTNDFWAGIVSGAIMTLSLTKSIYTSLHQVSKATRKKEQTGSSNITPTQSSGKEPTVSLSNKEKNSDTKESHS